MQSHLSSQLIQARLFLSRCHSSRLGGLALHCALPGYGRRMISNSSKKYSSIPARVTQARGHKSLNGASQNKLQPMGRNLEADPVFPSTIDSREPLLDLQNHERLPIDMEEAMKSSHQGLDKEVESSNSWSYVKPDAPWGFVVYRAVYGKESDEPWGRMLSLLRDIAARPVPGSGPNAFFPTVLSDPHFELTVIEDEERFAGADSHTIREAFREWVAHDLPPRVLNPDTQGGVDNIRAMIRSKIIREPCELEPKELLPPWWMAPPRWGFCFLVDDICLRSLNRADGFGDVVKMVNLRFHGGRCENIAEGWEDGETDDHNEDVGWMYASARSHRTWYHVLSDPSNWYDDVWYARPEKEEIPSAMDVGEVPW
jgi:hypothetical protein